MNVRSGRTAITARRCSPRSAHAPIAAAHCDFTRIVPDAVVPDTGGALVVPRQYCQVTDNRLPTDNVYICT